MYGTHMYGTNCMFFYSLQTGRVEAMKMNIAVYCTYSTVRKSTGNGSSVFSFTKIIHSTVLHTYILDNDAKSHQ